MFSRPQMTLTSRSREATAKSPELSVGSSMGGKIKVRKLAPAASQGVHFRKLDLRSQSQSSNRGTPIRISAPSST